MIMKRISGFGAFRDAVEAETDRTSFISMGNVGTFNNYGHINVIGNQIIQVIMNRIYQIIIANSGFGALRDAVEAETDRTSFISKGNIGTFNNYGHINVIGNQIIQVLIQLLVSNYFSEESLRLQVQMLMNNATQLEQFLKEGKNMEVGGIIEIMETATKGRIRYGAFEVHHLAVELNRIGYRIQAFAWFVCAFKKVSLMSGNDSRFGWMNDCFFYCYEVLSHMMEQGVQQKQFASGEGLKITDGLFRNASLAGTSDPGVKVLAKANRLTQLGIRDFNLKENPEGKKYFQQGIDCMFVHFGQNAYRYHSFLWLLFRLGRCESSLKHYLKFDRLRKEVIYALERVNDWPFTNGKEHCERILIRCKRIPSVEVQH